MCVLVPSSALRIIKVIRMNGRNTAMTTEAIAGLARLSVAAFTARVMAADAAISIISFLHYTLYRSFFNRLRHCLFAKLLVKLPL